MIYNSCPVAQKALRELNNPEMAAIRVLIDLTDNRIILDKPEILPHPVFPWRSDYKWVVRSAAGKMRKDKDGKWMVYTYGSATPSTLERRGVGERWAILPADPKKRAEVIRQGLARAETPRPDFKMLAAGG